MQSALPDFRRGFFYSIKQAMTKQRPTGAKNTTMKKKYLPVSIDITGEKILVLGGGKDAVSKIQILQRFGANIEVVAQSVCAELQQLGVKYTVKNYEAADLDNCLMVYSCIDDEVIDRSIVADAREKGILVNIHDKPALCQFISPAVYQKENITVAVSSNGENVFHSIKLRNHLQDYLNKNIHKIID